MGNEVSMQSGRAEEVSLLKAAVLAGDVPAMQSLLQQKQGLIYSHSKDGENIWHAAAQGGHPEVCMHCAWQLCWNTYTDTTAPPCVLLASLCYHAVSIMQ